MKRNDKAIIGLISLLLSACGSGDSATICDDDSVCPEPGICVPGGGCMAPDSACEVSDDGNLCDEGNGRCQGGECVAFICGDSRLDANESCDGPVADGACADDDLGYDFGTPSCEACSGPGTDRCGFIGWRDLGPKSLVSNSLYATGDEMWLGGLNATYYDGTNWRPLEGLTAFSAIHGSSRDNIWAFSFGSVYRFDGASWGAAIAIEGIGSTAAVLTVGASEAYVVGESTEGAPTIWQYDGERWGVAHSQVAGSPFVDIIQAGDTIIAAGSGTTSVRNADGLWNDFAGEPANVRNLWARNANDVYVAAASGIFHFDGGAFANIASLLNANVGGVGDLTYFVATGQMLVHRAGRPFSETRRLRAEGKLGAGGNRISQLFSLPDRVIAILGYGIHAFDGTGFSVLTTAGSARDISVTGTSLYWIRDDDSGRAIGVVDNAFSLSPSPSIFPVTEPIAELWARGPNDVFAIAAGEIVHWDGAATSSVLDPVAIVLHDIDGNGETAMAVGRGGAALLEDGQWDDLELAPSAPEQLAVHATSSGAFITAGLDGSIFIYANSSWRTVSSTTNVNLVAIDGASIEDFWVVGAAGTILHCQGQGAALACESTAPETALSLSDITVASASDILATSNGERALHFDGLKWSPVNLGPVHTATASAGVIWLGNQATDTGFLKRLDRIVSWDATQD